MLDDGEVRSRANTGESVRRQRQPKLYHSRSDDTRRRSFDKHRRDSQQASRHSLNTQVVLEACAAPEYELKYFATASSTETNLQQDNRANSDESHHHVVEINLDASSTITSEQISVESDALLEEPELENLTDPEDDSDDSDQDKDREIDQPNSKLETQSSKGSCKKRLVPQQTVLHVDVE